MSNVTNQNQNNKNKNEMKKENTKMEKKQFTIQELATKTNIPQGTIRAWTMKPIAGQIYNSNDVNYQNLQSKLIEYYGDKLKEVIGCKALEVEIVKGLSRATKDWLKIEDIKVNDKIILHNYTLKTNLTFVGTTQDEQTIIYLFKGDKGYKAYTKEDLDKENIKMEVAQ